MPSQSRLMGQGWDGDDDCKLNEGLMWIWGCILVEIGAGKKPICFLSPHPPQRRKKKILQKKEKNTTVLWKTLAMILGWWILKNRQYIHLLLYPIFHSYVQNLCSMMYPYCAISAMSGHHRSTAVISEEDLHRKPRGLHSGLQVKYW